MMKSIWTGLFLAAAAASAVAQDYIYVTNRAGGANGVSVFKQASPATLAPAIVRTINDASFQQANSIVAVASRRRLYVSNAGANPGTITVINGDTLKVDTVFTVNGSQQLTGISASADDQAIYVAGLDPTAVTGGPTVWRVDLGTGVSTVAGSHTDPGIPALDCAIIEANAVGGVGNGPGKLYFSVPTKVPGYIGIVNILGGGTYSQINTNAAPLTLVGSPARMDRSPDHKLVFVSCSNIGLSGGPDNNLHLIGINTSTDAPADIVLQNNGSPNPYTTMDVSFRPEIAAVRAFVLGSNGGVLNIYLVDSGGAVVPPVLGPNPPPAALTVNHHLDAAGNDFLYYGESTGASTGFGRFNVATGAQLAAGTSGANGPTKFAFMTMPPAPGIDQVCPKGNVNAAGNVFTVEGANFIPTAVIQVPGAVSPITLATTFVNSGTLQGTTAAGMLLGEQDVTVINPDGQSTLLHQFYTTCGAALTPWSQTLPSLSAGYSMFSVPQYSSVSSLRAALAASLGPYNPVFYRIFFWEVDHYVELDNMVDDCDVAGRAFWALTRLGGSFTLNGLDCFANRVSGTRVIPLNPGWNMISMPYQNGAQIHMNWTNVQVTADGAAWTGAGPADGTPALLNPLLYEFVNGAYSTVNVLQTGHGYFVNNVTSSFIYLLFNGVNVFKPGPGPATTYTALAAGAVSPPGPPGEGVADGSSSKKHGCGFLGPELLLVALAFHRLRRRRRLGA
jgi:hypothetical protein